MKKTLAIAAMVAMVPLSAHAKTAITDSDMNKVTGQAGVSIDLDVRMDVTADTVAWGQSDGTNTNWIGMKGFAIDNLTVKLRPDLLGAVVTDTLTLAGAVQAGAPAATLAALQAKIDADKLAVKPLTIDVATVPAGSTDGNKAAGTSYVRIGLGSLEIAASSIDFTVALGHSAGTAAPTAANLSQELGSVHLGGLQMEMNGASTVDIYSTNPSAAAGKGSGVVFDLAVTIDSLKAASLSWGNTAGSFNGPSTSAMSAPAATSAGYVGLANLNIANMTITGPVSIQVGTVATDTTAAAGTLAAAYAANPASAATAQALSAYYYSLYSSIGSGKPMSASFVHIGLGTGDSLSGSALTGTGGFVFGMGSMTADVKVASNADLSGGGSYGSIGINNMKVGVNGWVNIGTH